MEGLQIQILESEIQQLKNSRSPGDDEILVESIKKWWNNIEASSSTLI